MGLYKVESNPSVYTRSHPSTLDYYSFYPFPTGVLHYTWLTLYFSDERESVQKKTFQKWVNSHLVRVHSRIGDLYIDLRDGKMLIKLLEVLSGERLVTAKLEI